MKTDKTTEATLDTITVNGVTYTRGNASQPPSSPEVIVRTDRAGVHIGTKVSAVPGAVVLKDARRLWHWRGAFTLNEVAVRGVDRASSRISCNVPEITLLDAIEIIPVAAGVDLSPTEK